MLSWPTYSAHDAGRSAWSSERGDFSISAASLFIGEAHLGRQSGRNEALLTSGFNMLYST